MNERLHKIKAHKTSNNGLLASLPGNERRTLLSDNNSARRKGWVVICEREDSRKQGKLTSKVSMQGDRPVLIPKTLQVHFIALVGLFK